MSNKIDSNTFSNFPFVNNDNHINVRSSNLKIHNSVKTVFCNTTEKKKETENLCATCITQSVKKENSAPTSQKNINQTVQNKKNVNKQHDTDNNNQLKNDSILKMKSIEDTIQSYKSNKRKKRILIRNEKKNWSEKDFIKLKEGIKLYGKNWKAISNVVLKGKFNPIQCRKKNYNSSERCKIGLWSSNEEDLLIEGIKLLGSQWTAISKQFFKGKRSGKQCESKFNTMDNKNKRGPWSQSEIDIFLKYFERYKYDKNRWSKISQEMNLKRSRLQLQLKYNQLKITGRKWTEIDNLILVKGYKKYGNSWGMIAKEFFNNEFNFIQLKDKYASLKRYSNKWSCLLKEYNSMEENLLSTSHSKPNL